MDSEVFRFEVSHDFLEGVDLGAKDANLVSLNGRLGFEFFCLISLTISLAFSMGMPL